MLLLSAMTDSTHDPHNPFGGLDLLDLFLARKEPQDDLDRPDVRQVLHMVRAAKADSPI
jgi:hypothetical protein